MNGVTQSLRLPPTGRQSCAHTVLVSAATCSRVMEGCSFFCGVQLDQSLRHQNDYPAGPPSHLVPCSETAGLSCFVFILFLSVPVSVLGLRTSSVPRAGQIEDKTKTKNRGLTTEFLLERPKFLDSLLSYLSLLESSAVCFIHLYHDFRYHKTSTVNF